jgi:hypothetical protein
VDGSASVLRPNRLSRGSDGAGKWASLSPTTPATIATRHSSLATLADSPSTKMPYRAVPTAPIPTQIA